MSSSVPSTLLLTIGPSPFNGAAKYVQLSVVPQEMQNSSVALALELAAETARLADESGSGVASTAAAALVETIGQVCSLPRAWKLVNALKAAWGREEEAGGLRPMTWGWNVNEESKEY